MAIMELSVRIIIDVQQFFNKKIQAYCPHSTNMLKKNPRKRLKRLAQSRTVLILMRNEKINFLIQAYCPHPTNILKKKKILETS